MYIQHGDCRVTPTLMFRQVYADGILVALRYGPNESVSSMLDYTTPSAGEINAFSSAVPALWQGLP